MSSENSETNSPSSAGSRRLIRPPIHGVLVAIDAPAIAEQPYVVDALDINSGGMGLVLPEELTEGTEVFLSFSLTDDCEFSRVPAVVQYQRGASGGVRFGEWSVEDRLRLLEYLVSIFESR